MVIVMVDLITQAYVYAYQKHSGQTRKDGSIYINHPIQVAAFVSHYFAKYDNKDNLIIAGYLHDILEETKTPYDELVNKFNKEVADIVIELTNDSERKKELGKTKYMQEKFTTMSSDALNVKLCDRLANVYDLVNADKDFQKKYSLETENVLNYLLNKRVISETQLEIVNRIFSTLEMYKNKGYILK